MSTQMTIPPQRDETWAAIKQTIDSQGLTIKSVSSGSKNPWARVFNEDLNAGQELVLKERVAEVLVEVVFTTV